MNKTVTPGDLHGELRVLPSKSASHRAVMMAALARGKTLLEPMQLSKDIGATLACAQALGLTRGAAVAAGETEGFVRAEIWGGGEAEERPLRELDCGESGSTLRFFIPLALDGRGPVRLIGHGRLMQRPLTVYQNLFAPLGVVWRQEGDALTVEGELKSGRFELPGDVSSQFITGLLLALPKLAGDSEIVVTTPLESRAYVELTRRVQREFGVTSAWMDGGQTLLVRGGQEAVSPGTLHIEGDWSHAAFYLVAGAIGRGEIRLTGLDPQSAQGDRAVVEILRDMGADIRWEGDALVSRASRLHGLRVDCAQIPDLVPILAVAMAAAEGDSRITGAARDSVGGVIECAAVGVRAGVGSPFFGSVESVVSQLAFSVPAVKAIAFGDGMALAEMRGSEANDAMRMDGDGVTCESNHNGGVTGGITNGMPVIFRAAIKPTPSIARAQRTVDVAKRENAVLEIAGRHDPCIVPRAVVVMESILAIALCELEMDDAAQRALTE